MCIILINTSKQQTAGKESEKRIDRQAKQLGKLIRRLQMCEKFCTHRSLKFIEIHELAVDFRAEGSPRTPISYKNTCIVLLFNFKNLI